MNAPTPIRTDADSGAPVPLWFERSGGNLRCPHCGVPGRRWSSREIDVTLREIYFACANVACGHTWKASLVYDHGLSPSAIPNPAVNLPLKPLPRAEVLRAIADAAAPDPDPAQPGLFDPP